MNWLRSLAMLILIGAPALAGDWPQWLGPNRDGTSPEKIKPWKDKLKEAWRVEVGPGHSSPVVVNGNTAVVVTSYERPLPAVALAEVLATSDVPGGVVNLLTGSAATIAPWLAAHLDVNAIDLVGVAGDQALATDLEVAAADSLKRVRRAPAAEPDWMADPGLTPMTTFLETKTVWHPMGV